MPGRTPHAAVRAFTDVLSKAISRVALHVPRVSEHGYEASSETHSISLPAGIARLQGELRSGLRVRVGYRIVGSPSVKSRPWHVVIENYEYQVLDWEGRDMLVFHWHPAGRGQVSWPHVHIGTVALKGNSRLDRRKHIPTAAVSLPEVLRFVIADLGVVPLRQDWPTTLADAERALAVHPRV